MLYIICRVFRQDQQQQNLEQQLMEERKWERQRQEQHLRQTEDYLSRQQVRNDCTFIQLCLICVFVESCLLQELVDFGLELYILHVFVS